MIQSVGTTVHEAGTPQPTRKPNDSLGKEAFLTMLVAQLRHQDPLSPMNGDEMAAQLAQFSSLEQLTEIRDALVAQTDAQAAMLAMANGTAAIGLLGRTVVTDIPHLQVTDGAATPVEIDVSGVTVTTDPQDVGRATYVIEAVSEDPATKVGVFAQLLAHAGPDAILATTTSSLSIEPPTPTVMIVTEPSTPIL